MVCGHTHMPFDRLGGGRRFVNPGSVGMPYGPPGAAAYWALLRPEITLRRSPYDAHAAAERLRPSAWPDNERSSTRTSCTARQAMPKSWRCFAVGQGAPRALIPLGGRADRGRYGGRRLRSYRVCHRACPRWGYLGLVPPDNSALERIATDRRIPHPKLTWPNLWTSSAEPTALDFTRQRPRFWNMPGHQASPRQLGRPPRR